MRTSGLACVCVLAVTSAAGAACLPVPQAGCRRPTVPARTVLTITDRTPNTGDSVVWTWTRGEETLPAAFGDPLTATGYALCLYDESGATTTLVFQGTVPPGGTCGRGACWRPLARGGFWYSTRSPTADGMDQLLLAPGATGVAKVVARGRGANLSGRPVGLPPPPIALPLRVQLQATNGECWEAQYAVAIRNAAGRFRATGTQSPTTVTTTTTTLIPRPVSCAAVVQPPASCTQDLDCPAGYHCAAGTCTAGPCSTRADCPLEGECVFAGAETVGTCTCQGCGVQACPVGCRYLIFSGGCVCASLADCPSEDDVCFMGFCS